MKRALERVYIIIPPREMSVEPHHDAHPSRRVSDQYDRLAEELRQYMPATVDVMELPLKEAPSDGILLLAHDSSLDDDLAKCAKSAKPDEPRPILLDVIPRHAFTSSELLRPAAAVLVDKFGEWQMRSEGGYPVVKIYGLKSLAPALESRLTASNIGETEHYCAYTGREITLPALLAFYIDLYWQSLAEFSTDAGMQ
jgi:hypothetical protein